MHLTGNPFVDTGLMALASLASKESVAELSPDDLCRVYGTGSKLARTNQRLKSYTMVFGTNGALIQHAYKKIGKAEALYTGILSRLLTHIPHEGVAGEPCDLTGIRTTLDFQKVASEALVAAGMPAPEQKWVGRDWVPLGGSLGNDAQALPGASRPLHVSALALFALQYLPIGTFLFKGKLTCYQSTSERLTQDLVSEVVHRNTVNTSGEILEKGKGTGVILDYLLGCFDALREIQLSDRLLVNAELRLWLFSNSGAGADCLAEDIPEFALRFVWDAGAFFGHETRSLIAGETKDPRQQLFECIRVRKDYPGLYPFKKHPGASPEFYAFYQEKVCGVSPEALTMARALAGRIVRDADAKKAKDMRKPDFVRSPAGRNAVRRAIAANMSLSDYDVLFPSLRHPVRTTGSGWDLIRFYLTQGTEPTAAFPNTKQMKTTHPKIVQIGDAYFEEKGPKKIAGVLNRLSQRKIGVAWLQNIYCNFARDPRYTDFNLDTWDEFACDEEGKPIVFELLFQLRLYLANKYRESVSQSAKENHA